MQTTVTLPFLALFADSPQGVQRRRTVSRQEANRVLDPSGETSDSIQKLNRVNAGILGEMWFDKVPCRRIRPPEAGIANDFCFTIDAHDAEIVIARLNRAIEMTFGAVQRESNSIPISAEIDPVLAALLCDLDEIEEYAKEEGFPIPSTLARENADRLLREMFSILPWEFAIYPTQSGQIVIDVPNRKGSSVALVCGSEGGAIGVTNIPEFSPRSKVYEPSEVSILPDEFIRKSLECLEKIT